MLTGRSSKTYSSAKKQKDASCSNLTSVAKRLVLGHPFPHGRSVLGWKDLTGSHEEVPSFFNTWDGCSV